eukprot:3721013-Rhodomonas_salina.2
MQTSADDAIVLLNAAMTGVDALESAINAGAKPDAQDGDGNTVLWRSCQVGETDAVKLLISCRANVNLANSIGVTPLLMACSYGHFDSAQLLCATPDIEINRPSEDGTTPLLSACENGHLAIVHLLLQQPSLDRNATDSRGKSAWQWAVDRKNTNVVRLLEADVTGDAAAMRAVLAEAALIDAAARDDIETVAHKLDTGVPIDAQDAGGHTALFSASAAGHAASVKMLLARGANPNLGHKYGWTPLLIASINTRLEVLALLLAAPGVDVNQPSHNGGPSLPVAAQAGDVEVIKLLLQHPGINRDATHMSKTAVQWAEEGGHAEVVRLLQS